MFPRDVVCLRNININTLHKGDDDDDDDNNNNNESAYNSKVAFLCSASSLSHFEW